MGCNVRQRICQGATAQRFESRSCDIETSSGSVNANKMDRVAVRFVQNPPAPSAVSGVPHDVVSAADEREGGKLAERRVFPNEPVLPV